MSDQGKNPTTAASTVWEQTGAMVGPVRKPPGPPRGGPILTRSHTVESLMEDNLVLLDLVERLANQFRLWGGPMGRKGGLLGEAREALEKQRGR